MEDEERLAQSGEGEQNRLLSALGFTWGAQGAKRLTEPERRLLAAL
jgi:hypothetical protein